MSCGGHVEFVFHYRVTEFMRLIVDNLDRMETDSAKDVAEWMMKRIRGRVCTSTARFSIDEEDEAYVDNITVPFLCDLLHTCQKRQVERVDFEVDSEPRTVCWKCYCYTDEESPLRSCDESMTLEAKSVEGDLEDSFIDFLNRLEQRQELIKESALRILSPLRTTVVSEHNRLEKSVQTAPSCLPPDVFVPELPPPDLYQCHDAQLDDGSVDNFVDALFDFEPKFDILKNVRTVRCVTSPSFVLSRDFCWNYEDLTRNWERSLKAISTMWPLEDARYKTVSGQETLSNIEDLITLQETAVIAHQMQKRWNRVRDDVGLSMTAALITGVGGVSEGTQATAASEKVEKKKESEEWVNALLKMLEQKPAKSRKLLKGLINYSKDHKSNISSESDNAHTALNVYEYMKMKLKEHERAKKSEVNANLSELKPEKPEREANQHDIRAYMVGRKIYDPSRRTTGAQTDIREFCIGKKMKKATRAEVVEAAANTFSPGSEKVKSSKPKSTSKQRIAGKYYKLTKSPTLAVTGESPTTFVGVSQGSAVYAKSFKIVNLSCKELQISMSAVDWPGQVQLLHPDSVTPVGAGQTAEIPVAITRPLNAGESECLQLRVLHRNVPISHAISFKYNSLKEHCEGPQLSDLDDPCDVLTKLHKAQKKARCLRCPRGLDETKSTEETIHTVINMLKDEVESLCRGVFADATVQEEMQTVSVKCPSNFISDVIEAEMPIESEGKEQEFQYAESNEGDSITSDFEIVDVDEGGSMSSDQDEIDAYVV
ncbi:hypothetical protein RB195_018334 [Necator americanus]